MTNLFNWGSEDSEARRIREQRELELMIEQANAKASKTTAAAGGGGGGSDSPIFTGLVLDGKISGATVTDVDSGRKTTTDSNGVFTFKIRPTGKIEASGGIDTVTGFPYYGTLITPAGENIISPISTLVTKLMDTGLTKLEATTNVLVNFNKAQVPSISKEYASTLLKINYVDEALDNNNDTALTIQAFSNTVELIADISANMALSTAIGGDPNDASYSSIYKTTKDLCWDKISDDMLINEDFDVDRTIEAVNPAITTPMRKSINVAFNNGRSLIQDASSDQALNINYQTVAIAAANKTIKELKDIIILLVNPSSGVDPNNQDSCEAWLDVENIGEEVLNNRKSVGQVKKGVTNVTEETYSGYGIKETAAYYLNSDTFGDDAIEARGDNIIYAKDFKVGSSVWTSIEVWFEEEAIENYRYKWPTSDSGQTHHILASDDVYEISSLIGEKDREFEKEKQAYISKIYTVQEFLDEVGSSKIKVPEPGKIKLEDPSQGIPLPKKEGPDGGKNIPSQGLVNEELGRIVPVPLPTPVDPTVPGGERTEQIKYINPEHTVELIEAIEWVGGEIVKEEIIIRDQARDKDLISDVKDSDDKIRDEADVKKNAVSTEKIASAAAAGDKREYVSTKAKADYNYLEE